MEVKYTFIDLDGVFTASIKPFALKNPNLLIETRQQNIFEFHQEHQNEKGLCYVSPANSLGFMDGGIDKVYSEQIFPKIDKEVKYCIRNLKHHNLVGQAYLPIGSAAVIKRQDQFMISAPTMWLPQNVNQTKNAKNAFLAVLNATFLWNKIRSSTPIKHIVCSGLCTGYGKMTGQESASQIFEAFQEFNLKQSYHLQPYHHQWFQEFSIYFQEPPESIVEQPLYYENSQWKMIKPMEIIRSGS